MLHFCTMSDITGTLNIAGRFQDELVGVRDSVTAKINNYIRRNLEFVAGAIEYFDTPNVPHGQSFNIWLEKKQITAFAVGYSTIRDWDNNRVEADRFVLDPVNGKITAYGTFRQWQRSLRVTYDGGYPPRADDPTVMDCPSGLKYAAIQQCLYDARKFLNNDQGTSTDDDKKTKIRLIGNLLEETATAFFPYRRPLGR